MHDLIGPPPRTVRRVKNLGPLHDLLLRACPPDVNGYQSIPVLARHLEMTSQGVQKWIKAKAVPPKQVTRIVALQLGRDDIGEDERVTLADFSTYVFV